MKIRDRKNSKKSPLQLYKDELNASLKRVTEILHNIPEPSYEVNVGDRVIYGAFDWSGILEIYEGGKYYKIFSVTWLTGRNHPDCSEYRIHYIPWIDVNPYIDREWTENDRLVEDNEIFFGYSQRDVNHLLYLMVEKHGIDLEPEYQRGHVWNDKQKVELIDSIFKNIDIGKFTVIRRPWGNNPNEPKTKKLYEMLDGKQRIMALWEFYTSKFKYKGKYFHELHPFDRHHFKYYRISFAETDPLTNEQKYRYFLKLNTTGTPMSSEHMNKVYQMWLEEAKKNE